MKLGSGPGRGRTNSQMAMRMYENLEPKEVGKWQISGTKFCSGASSLAWP